MTAKTSTERSRAFKERMKAKGLAKFPIWIPDTQEARDAANKHAEKLRGESKHD